MSLIQARPKQPSTAENKPVQFWVILLACIAFGTFWSAGLFFRSELTPELVTFHYVGRVAKIVLCFGIAILAWRRNVNLKTAFFLANLFLLLAAIFFIPLIINEEAFIIVGILANSFLGIAGAFYSLLFIVFFSALAPRQCQFSIPFAFAICHILFLSSKYIPAQNPIILEIGASVIGPLLLCICLAKTGLLGSAAANNSKTQFNTLLNTNILNPTNSVPRNSSIRLKFFSFFSEYYIVILGAIVLPLFYGVVAQIFTEANINQGLFDLETEIIAIVSLLVIAVIGLREKGLDNLDKFFFILLPILATGLVLSSDRLFLAGAIIKCTRIIYLAVFWVFLARKAGGNPRMVCFLFGLGLGLTHLCAMTGRLIGNSIHASFGSAIDVLLAVTLLVIWVLALISLHLLSLRRANSPGETQESDHFSQKCAIFTQQYNLSERESEILIHFARGRSAQAIAKILIISNNTVKTHLRNIYTKVGIHSRQELLDILEDINPASTSQ